MESERYMGGIKDDQRRRKRQFFFLFLQVAEQQGFQEALILKIIICNTTKTINKLISDWCRVFIKVFLFVILIHTNKGWLLPFREDLVSLTLYRGEREPWFFTLGMCEGWGWGRVDVRGGYNVWAKGIRSSGKNQKRIKKWQSWCSKVKKCRLKRRESCMVTGEQWMSSVSLGN